MRQHLFSRAFVLGALCALTPVCFGQTATLTLPAPGVVGPGTAPGQETADQFGRPLVGDLTPGFTPFDTLISPLLEKYNIPGCTIAVMNNDKIIMSRGYGWADRDKKVPVAPDSLFRIGALSKPFTSAAILLLVERGKLTLDTPVFDVLKDLAPFEGTTRDPRLGQITVRQLLQHSGGWDAGASFEPFDRLGQIASAAKQASPPDVDAVIRYMMGQPLQFDPGTKFVYSNFGYVLLGRVIEKVSGVDYENLVSTQLLGPAGVTTFRLGATREQEHDPDEVKYYDYKNAPKVTSVFDANAYVTRPEGSVALESRGASDGWVGSAPDYLRFLGAIDGNDKQPDKLAYGSLIELARRPTYAMDADAYYGLGWNVRPAHPYDPKKPDDHEWEVFGSWWHEAALPGTSAFVGRDTNGHAWVAFFNSHPKDDKAWSDDMQEALYNAVAQSQWPDPNAPAPDPNVPPLPALNG